MSRLLEDLQLSIVYSTEMLHFGMEVSWPLPQHLPNTLHERVENIEIMRHK